MAEADLGMQEQYRKEGAASGVLAALVSGQWSPSGGGGAVSVNRSPFTVGDSAHSVDHVTHISSEGRTHEGQVQMRTGTLCAENIHSKTPRL